MHARVHTTSKLSRKVGPRRALIKGLVDSLILYERITTTEAKAKVIVPYFEKMVTHAKRGNLSDIRYVASHTASHLASQKLTTELVEGFRERTGGYVRIVKVGPRRGDNAAMAMVELILPANFSADKATADKKTTKKDSTKAVALSKAKPKAIKAGESK